MGSGDWFGVGSLAVSAMALGMAFLRTVRVQGGDRQRIRALEEARGNLASSETVTAMGGRLDNLEADVRTVAAAVTKVSVIEEQVRSLDRLVTNQLDEIKNTLRRLEERSFAPAGGQRGRRRTPAD